MGCVAGILNRLSVLEARVASIDARLADHEARLESLEHDVFHFEHAVDEVQWSQAALRDECGEFFVFVRGELVQLHLIDMTEEA